MWRTYWGQLGWLDYNASAAWYMLLLALVVVNIACLHLAAAPARPT